MKQEEINKYNKLSSSLSNLSKYKKGGSMAIPEKIVTVYTGKPGRDGKDGINGKDGLDGRNGANGRDGIDGKNGTDITPEDIASKLNTLTKAIKSEAIDLPKAITADDVIAEIKNKKGNDRLDISNIRNGEQLASLATKANGGYNMNDQRWHGAGNSSPRVKTIVSSATPTVNTNDYNNVSITALATAITSMTTNLSGTPNNFDKLVYRIKDDGTGRAISWGSAFASRGATLPTTTTANKLLYVGFFWNSIANTWDCVATCTEA